MSIRGYKALRTNLLKIVALSSLFVWFSECSFNSSSGERNEGFFYLEIGARSEEELYKVSEAKVNLPESAVLFYGNKEVDIDEINTRGLTSLSFMRKNFSIETDGKLKLAVPSTNDTIKTAKFILSSMSMDDSYFGNKVSYEVLKRVGLWPLNSFYTKVYINGKSQGLYLYTDDLKDYAFKHLGAKFILRRGYNGRIADVYYKGKSDFESKLLRGYNRVIAPKIGLEKKKLLPEFYVDRFNSLYGFLSKYEGKQLFDSISSVLNLDNYMKKIAVDNILKNGDYTDEVFFYSKSKPGEKVYFDILPWDYDDVFTDLPHEIGRTDTLCGKVFGLRQYPEYSDYVLETNGRFVFSIEDDLDYKIVKDDYLYQKYLECFKGVLSQIDTLFVERTFTTVYQQVRPFFDDSDVIEQSKFDENKTSIYILETQIKEKKKMLTDRITFFSAKMDSLGVKAVN